MRFSAVMTELMARTGATDLDDIAKRHHYLLLLSVPGGEVSYVTEQRRPCMPPRSIWLMVTSNFVVHRFSSRHLFSAAALCLTEVPLLYLLLHIRLFTRSTRDRMTYTNACFKQFSVLQLFPSSWSVPVLPHSVLR